MTDRTETTDRSSWEWETFSDDEVPFKELLRRLTWDIFCKIDAAFGRKQ